MKSRSIYSSHMQNSIKDQERYDQSKFCYMLDRNSAPTTDCPKRLRRERRNESDNGQDLVLRLGPCLLIPWEKSRTSGPWDHIRTICFLGTWKTFFCPKLGRRPSAAICSPGHQTFHAGWGPSLLAHTSSAT